MYGEKQELDDIVGNYYPVLSAFNLTNLSLRDFSILFKALDRDSQACQPGVGYLGRPGLGGCCPSHHPALIHVANVRVRMEI